MNFLKKLLTGKTTARAGQPLWEWFLENEPALFHVVKSKDSRKVNDRFLKALMPRLQALCDTLYCEVGMFDETRAELVISAQGDVKSFVFAEDLVAAAPDLTRWKITALKPALGFHNNSIHIDGYVFNCQNIGFFYHDDPEYPDEIRLSFIYQDLKEENKNIVTQGVFLLLETVLGERDAATLIDQAIVKGPSPDDQELIPMAKLIDFLNWKEKEFVERYQGVRHETENDNFSGLEGQDAEGLPSIGVVNQDLLHWDAKASHPWMLVIEIDYTKTKSAISNGMPDDEHYQCMCRLEEELTRRLTDSAGYLALGRETYKGKTTIYMACKEYRVASKTTHDLLQQYKAQLACSYDMYKDKYWRTMEKFRAVLP
ncbi:MAG TPA: DUF695 domain-containing protein [Puia sp.]|nr:DUF695 domain-containing protein [Puia sp.]